MLWRWRPPSGTSPHPSLVALGSPSPRSSSAVALPSPAPSLVPTPAALSRSGRRWADWAVEEDRADAGALAAGLWLKARCFGDRLVAAVAPELGLHALAAVLRVSSPPHPPMLPSNFVWGPDAGRRGSVRVCARGVWLAGRTSGWRLSPGAGQWCPLPLQPSCQTAAALLRHSSTLRRGGRVLLRCPSWVVSGCSMPVLMASRPPCSGLSDRRHRAASSLPYRWKPYPALSRWCEMGWGVVCCLGLRRRGACLVSWAWLRAQRVWLGLRMTCWLGLHVHRPGCSQMHLPLQ